MIRRVLFILLVSELSTLVIYQKLYRLEQVFCRRLGDVKAESHDSVFGLPQEVTIVPGSPRCEQPDPTVQWVTSCV